MRETIETNGNGVSEIVEHADVKKDVKEQHRYDSIKIKDRLTIGGKYSIQVFLDCSCGFNDDQLIALFVDNDLLSAEDNFKGWFIHIATWFIKNDYKLIDCRQGKECSDEN